MELSTLARFVGFLEEADAKLTEIAWSGPLQALAYLLTDEGAAEMRRGFAEQRARELRASPFVGYLRP